MFLDASMVLKCCGRILMPLTKEVLKGPQPNQTENDPKP